MKRAWLLLSAFSCVSLTEINLQPARPASPLLLRRLVGGGDASNTVSDQFQRPDVGATSAPPLRVAPAAGDVIVGHTENCNCSTMVEAVWYLCWEEDSRTGGRIYARTGQQSWNGPIVVPENSTLHVIGPTSAQLCGQWRLREESAGSFTGVAVFWGDLNSSKATLEVEGGRWLFEHTEMAGAGIDVMHCTRDAEASLRRCVVGGMDDAHRQAADGVVLRDRAKAYAIGCTIGNVMNCAVLVGDDCMLQMCSSTVQHCFTAVLAKHRAQCAFQGCVFEKTGCDGPALKFVAASEGVVENCELRSGVSGVHVYDDARVALRNSTVHQMLSGAVAVGGREANAEVEVTNCVIQGKLWGSDARPSVAIVRDNEVVP